MQKTATSKPAVYIIGSLRNPLIPKIGDIVRSWGYEAFDDWYAAGPTADDSWQEYEKARGTSYPQALQNYAARHVFAFDKHHLDRAAAGILVLPAGKSGHLELGYLIGTGKPGFVLFDGEPDRWDVMYQFANYVAFDVNDLREPLKLSMHASNYGGIHSAKARFKWVWEGPETEPN